MKALGLDLDDLATRFVELDGHSFVLVEVLAEEASAWAKRLGVPSGAAISLTGSSMRTYPARVPPVRQSRRRRSPIPGQSCQETSGRSSHPSTSHPSRARVTSWTQSSGATRTIEPERPRSPTWCSCSSRPGPTPSSTDTVLCAEVKAASQEGCHFPADDKGKGKEISLPSRSGGGPVLDDPVPASPADRCGPAARSQRGVALLHRRLRVRRRNAAA